MPVTPNVGLNIPAIGSNNWGGPLNFNFSLLDQYFGGTKSVPNFSVSGNMTVTGTISAGTFSGLNGSYFLQSSLFNQPNGVPQLNSAGMIPASLISGGGIITVAYSTVPSFNGSQAGGFNMTLTGNVTASTFISGVSGAPVVAFRITQDSIGGHTFVWPSNVRNAGTVSPGASARSVQLFMLQTDGSLDAASPMMYS